MKQFQFTTEDGIVQATVVVDIVDKDAKHFTIMEIRGGKSNVFENKFPWKLGETLHISDIEKWYGENQAVFPNGYMYGGLEVVQLGADNVKKLTLTADITTDGSETTVGVKIIETAPNGTQRTMNETLTDAVAKDVTPIYVGYKYKVELTTTGAAWTSGSAPDEITCDGDETLTVAVTYAD
jgi:hypothetical protein